MTSVKDFRIETAPTPESLGRGVFAFTDDYSVFDWGKMPDEIPQKGASLCSMGAFNFERLDAAGVSTHYLGVGSPDGVVDVETALAGESPPTEMAIELTHVPELPFEDGSYAYDAYHEAGGRNYLVPLEIVFRNTVPVGSSLRRRTAPTEHGLDHDTWPDEAVDLETPVVEFSTKYEEQDRYLDHEEADRIAGRAELTDLEAVAREVNEHISEQASAAGLDHQDGKIECLYYDGDVRVADVVGTFDENRFAYDGQQVSKEVIRQYYKREHPDWVEAVAAAKRRADAEGVADWRELCAQSPPSLPEGVLETASDLYAAGANAYVGTDSFEAPDLASAVEAAREL